MGRSCARCPTANAGGVGLGFIWENGETKRLLPTPTPITAYAINDLRPVTGIFGTLAGEYHAFLWEDGVTTDLGTLCGNYSIGWDINDAAQSTGSSFTGTGEHAFLWQDGVMNDLGALGNGHSQGLGINPAGQIVGDATPSEGVLVPLLWEAGEMGDLRALIEDDVNSANAINNVGQILLWNYLYDLTTGEGAYLEDLLPPGSGWSELLAQNMNDAGQIVGAGRINGKRRAFLMTPIPPPPVPAVSAWGSLLMALALLTAAAIVRGRRQPGGPRPRPTP